MPNTHNIVGAMYLILCTMSKTVTKGDVKIVSIEASKKEGWVRVGFEQEITTTYQGTPDDTKANGLGFMNAFGDPMEPRVYHDTRKAFENVKLDVLERNNMKEGSTVPGMKIGLFAHQIPLSDSHKKSEDGKYYTTRLVKNESPDRVEVALEESQAIYNSWKAAVSAVSSEATTLKALSIQSIPD